MGSIVRAVGTLAAAVMLAATASACEAVVRISETSTGAEVSGASSAPAVSGEGRYIVFNSLAPDLVPGDTNGVSDVFVKDTWSDTVERVSIDGVGTQANGASTEPAISDDGRHVAFTTEATNLVFGDDNGVTDVVVFDRVEAVPTLVSVDGAGVVGDAASSQPSVSESGRYVGFTSAATNLASMADNGFTDVFLRDVVQGTTTNVSGRYAYDASTNVPADGNSYDPVVQGETSDYGEPTVEIGFTSDAENLFSRCAAETPLVSDVYWTLGGGVGNLYGAWPIDGVDTPAGSLTLGGRESFVSAGQVYRALRETGDFASCFTGPPTLLSRGLGGAAPDGPSSQPVERGGDMYTPGRVAFVSAASNLVAGDTNGVADVFVWDETSGRITRASGIGSRQANGPSDAPSLSHDGRFVAFGSAATNLVDDDTNGAIDVFARPAVRPAISGVTPGEVAAGGTATVTITGTDFGPGAVVSFGPGVTVQQVTVDSATQIRAVVVVEPDAAPGPRSIEVTFPPGGSASCNQCVDVSPSVPTLSIADATVTEGTGASTTVSVAVDLSPAAGSAVTVRYGTADGSAVYLPVGDRDYVAASGTVTFTAGQTSRTILLRIAGDVRVEADETFTVDLSNPSPTTTPITDATATVTIVDDD